MRAPDDTDLLDEMFAALVAQLPELADHQSRLDAVRRAVREQFAGIEVYLPKRTTQARREDVLRHFNGRNATEVARQLGISRATVYRLLKRPGR